MSLRPYPPDELESMWTDSRARYERDLVDNGGLAAEEAHAKTERDGEWLSGRDTLVFEIEHEGVRIGRVVLWLDAFDNPGQAWLFEIVLDEEVRGRGLGREALRLAEAEARSRGMERIALNVFGGNEVARSLYRGEGYAETSVRMAKRL
ncbi:MAG TPA: GNAT family N-acetyltransferase [Gaiellaceae bacterium]